LLVVLLLVMLRLVMRLMLLNVMVGGHGRSKWHMAR
jgi:hypothetical protein